MKHMMHLLFLILAGPISMYPQNPLVQTMINSVNIDSLIYFVKELSGEVPTIINGPPYTIVSRRWNHAGNDSAATYLKKKLQSYGLLAYDQNFGSAGRNVYAVQLGTVYPNKKYIICAHYDSYTPSGPIAPGADDNASGTAAVIEAARIFHSYSFPFTLVYALWDEEERGLYGSDYFATQARNQGDDIIAVINFDMIAYDSNNDNVAEIHTRPIAYSLALKDSMVAVNSRYDLGVSLNIIDPGLRYSDHYSFWQQNYSAVLLIERYYGDFNAHYHTIDDRITYFNQPYFLKLSKLAIGTFANLAISDTPLPVELSLFTASYINSSVLLKWRTETEVSNYGFGIERRVNGENWQSIAFIQGYGNSNSPKDYSYTDSDIFTGGIKFQYRLKQIDNDGTYVYSELVEVEVSVKQFELFQNYPNPFNPSTEIEFKVPVAGLITLKIYDVLGNEVAVLVKEQKESGQHKVTFEASNLPSGVYFYTLQAGEFTSIKKMILLK